MPESQYQRGKRRRMDKFKLNEVSAVTTPAQGPALAAIRKSDDEIVFKQDGPRSGETFDQFLARMRRNGSDMSDGEARAMFERVAKGGDMADMFTSIEEGHQHAIHVYEHDDGVNVMVGYATAPGAEHSHDHQITRGDDGMYIVSENVGHSHTIDGMKLQEIIMMRMMMKSEDIEKQALTREVRERLARSGAALPDGSFPIRNRSDLRNAISAFGRARMQDRGRVARHIRRRARALRAVDMLPEEGVLAGLLKSDDQGEGEPVDKEDLMSDDLKKAQEQIAALKAEMEKMSQVAALSTAHKAFYDSISGDDVAKSREAFMAKSDAERDAEIKKAEDAKLAADPVVFTADDGTEYRKSDDPRLVQMAKSRDEDRKETTRLRNLALDADLEKRAESDLQYLPGDIEVRKAMLSAVDGIEDETMRKSALNALKAHNAKLAPAFETVGSAAVPLAKASDKAEAEAELDKLAKDYAAKEGKDFYEAYDIVSKSNPDLLRKAVG